jgi:ribosomal protein S18 acetylase RimI-like enzyme
MELEETDQPIWFEELQNRKKISKIFSRYEKTFPEDERRSKEQFLDLAENPDVFVFLIKNEDETIGYCVIWELSDFYFLEHFEVFEEFRNQKFGEKILESLEEKFEKIVLETEPDSLSEIAARRFQFYQRNGFNIIEKNYLQPSYGEGKSSLHLFLMANFSTESVENSIKEIHKIVYEI